MKRAPVSPSSPSTRAALAVLKELRLYEKASAGCIARLSEIIDTKMAHYANGAPMFADDGTMLDDKGNRSIFDDVDE